MKILIVTNMLEGTNAAHPTQGVFVAEQIESIRRIPCTEVEVLVVAGFEGKGAYLRSLFTILAKARRARYDAIHYHFGLTAWSAPFVRWLTGIPVVVTLHGSDVAGAKWMRRVSRFAVRFADVCIAVSDVIEKDVRKVVRKAVVIPCAVNDHLFTPPVARKHPPEEIVVVFPSSPARPEKDYPLFSAALQCLRGMTDKPIVERHIDGLDRQGVRDLLQNADAMLMTSKREGSPQAVKEALACALPVVSTDVGDVAELLDGVNRCRVVSARDAHRLAKALLDVLDGDRCTEGPVRLAEKGYLSANVAQRIHDVYRTAMKQAPENLRV
ncbi:glycosyltransferase [Caballeronia zhejiangensis]|uniref:glycosyltransferase n=1 Tax=Caballeronia zhejiangensis TaxID=871203 RepID=UPI001F52986B|nr:glycosyltransferase [Caballeronia zhejiangensis]MCI1047006.1 glycosyltransferase [Caballeronia zhejiangensis]